MEGFAAMFARVGEFQKDQFLENIEEIRKLPSRDDALYRKAYVFSYLQVFLGNLPEFTKMLYMPDTEFHQVCHNVIDNVSLCVPEVDFFHQMVDMDAKTVQDYIDLYDTVERLPRCQLGSGMKACLDATKKEKLVILPKNFVKVTTKRSGR